MNESDEKPPFSDPSFDSDDARDKGGFVGEFVKKVAVAGLGAVFMTEEGIRNLAGQLKLPKEVLQFIVSQADRTKGEIGRVVSEELRRFLQSETLRDEFLKLLTGMTVEIKAEVRLKPSETAAPRDAKSTESAATEAPPSEKATNPELVVTELTARRGGRRSKKE